MDSNLENWKKGDGFDADHLQQPVDAIKAMWESGPDTIRGNSGTARLGASQPLGTEERLAVICDPPPGESDYSDGRYWCCFVDLSGDEVGSTNGPVVQSPSPTYFAERHTDNSKKFVAWNLSECSPLALSHTLGRGEVVRVSAQWDTRSTHPTKRWVMVSGTRVSLGIIKDHGPNGEPNYTTNGFGAEGDAGGRYWVEVKKAVTETSENEPLSLYSGFGDNDDSKIVTVTNISEAFNGLRQLNVGQPVMFFEHIDRQGRIRRVMSQNAANVVMLLATVDGGDAGSPTTTCDFTYTVHEAGAGNNAFSEITPVKPRYANCEYAQPPVNAAAIGVRSASGYTLLEVFEEVPVGDVISLISSIRVDGSTKKLQYKTRPALVLELYDEDEDWSDFHTGVECPEP